MKLAMMTIDHDCYKEAEINGKIISVHMSSNGAYWKILYEPAMVAGTFNVNTSFTTIPAPWWKPAPDLG